MTWPFEQRGFSAQNGIAVIVFAPEKLSFLGKGCRRF